MKLLEPGTLLKGGMYRIIRSSGQDGSGVTYEAELVLQNRRVIIRAFNDAQLRNASTDFALDNFEENGTAFSVKEALSGEIYASSEWEDESLWIKGFGKEVNIKPVSDPNPVGNKSKVTPLEYLPAHEEGEGDISKNRTMPGSKRKMRIVLCLGLLAAVAAVVFLVPRSSVPPQDIVVPQDLPQKRSKAEIERPNYDRMVVVCRDSISAWSDSRGTVPVDALNLLNEIKNNERLYSQSADGYNRSSDLAHELVGKMGTAMEKWENAGNRQVVPLNSDVALTCYQLALELAEAIQSVKQDVLDMADAQMEEDIRRIQGKIRNLGQLQ